MNSLGPVFKFGGTSMGSVERIEHVAEICLKLKPSAIVVSAMAGETNRLISLGASVFPRTDVPEYDLLVGSGEQVSTALLCLALRKRGANPAPMLAPSAGIITSADFSKAQILMIKKEMILSKIQQGFLPVIAGFQGFTEDGQMTSLGRGGSDTSAVAVCAGIGAKECVIYTDVDGVFTTDPRLCSKARIIPRISAEEMLEMASQGSKVLHTRSVYLAAKWGIRLTVKNTFSDSEGTTMISGYETIEGEIVTGVAASKEESWFQVGPIPEQSMSPLFTMLAQKNINVDIISKSLDPRGMTLHFTVGDADAPYVKEAIGLLDSTWSVSLRQDVSKVSIVGVGMRTHPGVAARLFKSIESTNSPILLVTTSEIKVACLVPRDKLTPCVQAIHAAFLEEKQERGAN